jgi:hypothetical protein
MNRVPDSEVVLGFCRNIDYSNCRRRKGAGTQDGQAYDSQPSTRPRHPERRPAHLPNKSIQSHRHLLVAEFQTIAAGSKLLAGSSTARRLDKPASDLLTLSRVP